MSGFQILFGQPQAASPATARSSRGFERRAAKPLGVLDVMVDGMNVTARVGEGQTLPFLRDLAHATADLASGRRGRATVPFYAYDGAWELGLTRDGGAVLLSVFRSGASPDVAVHERRLDGLAMVDGVTAALAAAIEDRNDDESRDDLVCALDLLRAGGNFDLAAPLDAPEWISVEAPKDPLLSFACDLALRSGGDDARTSLARADLLALLAKSRMRVTVRGRTRELGEGFAFLVAERLVEIAKEALDAETRGVAMYKRGEIAGIRFAVRVTKEGELGLTLRRADADPASAGETYPGLSPRVLAQAVVAFGRALGRAFVRADRSQLGNLRLSSFRASVKALAGSLRPRTEYAPRLNDAPESYRAYALSSRRPVEATPARGPQKLRFQPRWVAAVPGIDLSATFLCGDRLIASGSREVGCLDRATGELLWSRPAVRAMSVPTPGGLARLHVDGTMDLHDYGTGELAFSLKLAPKVGGAPAGAVVHAPGLPKLFVVTEGERHLSAVDLVSGDVRWRHTLSRSGICRVRRAGRLLIEASGDLHLSAIDAPTGEIVWRLCDKAPFASAPTFDHDTLFAVAGGALGNRTTKSRLLAVDAWSGAVRWDAALPARVTAASSPLVSGDVICVVTRGEEGLGLAGYDRATGEERFHLPPGLAPIGTAWLAVDDAVFANTDRGQLLAIDVARGEIRFRLQLTEGEGDASPRRLEPVLRSGALFVPQREIHVLRPSDGEQLGQVPCDLIPDLLRVDERCDVFVAEESGHVAAFGAGARLTLVKHLPKRRSIEKMPRHRWPSTWPSMAIPVAINGHVRPSAR